MKTDSPKLQKSIKNIVFVGPIHFPDSSAPTRRILGIAHTLKQLGHKVIVGSGDANYSSEPKSSSITNAPCICHVLKELPPSNASKLSKAIHNLTWGKATKNWLEKLTPCPDLVFIFGGYTPYSRKLMPWAKKNGIPIVNDVVEWFQPSHLPGGWLGPFHWNVEIALRYYYPKAKNIIAISRYLEDYYHKKHCHVLRMPPTLDVFSANARTTITDGPITLAYAGFPGKKDLIVNVIQAVMQLDPKGEKIKLKMAGPSPEEILRIPALHTTGINNLPPCLEAMGKLSHEKVIELVRQADYVPLLRKPQRYAMAGFPTKIPECMSLGTPAICNATSNLEDHVKDGKTGFICNDYTTNAFQITLRRALNLSIPEREAMRRAARTEAEQAFDYRVFIEPMAQFLEQLEC